MIKTGFNGYVYDFSVDYDTTDVDDIKDIYKYLMKKNNIVEMKISRFVKKVFFCRINNFMRFYKRKFFELYFIEQSRVLNKTSSY